MTLREQISEQIRQNRRPLRICAAIAGGLMLAPLVFIGKMHGAANPGEFGPLFVILALTGGVFLIVLAITNVRIRCPKCRGLLGYDNARTGKYCRHCGADFDAPGNEPRNPLIGQIPKEAETDKAEELRLLRGENARLRQRLFTEKSSESLVGQIPKEAEKDEAEELRLLRGENARLRQRLFTEKSSESLVRAEKCPACGAAIPAEAVRCPDCQVAL